MKKYLNYYKDSDLGKRITQLREKKKITQEDLADHLQISQTNMTFIEQGKRPISLHKLLQVADLFETDLDYLVTGTASKNAGLADTGLQNESIEILRELFATSDKVTSQRALFALNTLISDRKFLTCLGQYLQNDFDQALTVWSDDQEKEITFSAADVTVPPFPFFEIDFEKAARLTLLEYLTLMKENRLEQYIEESRRKRGRKRKENN